ncbi:hypothetical protein EI983_15060 [Roseovarius faecimaris]|uniref:Sialidase domain-containing protein n=1 Tax=Roseovarius faecimaris TaxID=2494550 RepID=A0A6I6IRY9_9RHOB|nr:exo-alpha-sialidase [Roseovarius faecimaris]QGX99515.1 hypothetical protein EI983_15060 [Roseovarius faecimaris]
MEGVLIQIMALVSLGLTVLAWRREPRLVWRFVPPETVTPVDAARFEKIFDYTAETGQAHSPAILLDDGDVVLAWFEGSEEAQADVDIRGVRLCPGTQGWKTVGPDLMMTRGELSDAFTPDQLVVTLGNTVQDDANPHSLFATVVSVGGWAMASIARVRMGPRGPALAEKLSLSPFLNRSYLVKSPMVAMADGTYALPAYFEMGATYGSFIRFDRHGRVCDARRMTGQRTKPIQPMVVPLNETDAVAFLRNFEPGGRLLISGSEDGGQSWSVAQPIDIANPSAPVAALALGNGLVLMAMNDQPAAADTLRLVLSEDEGLTWRVLKELEKDGGDARYPMLRRLGEDGFVLSYSHGTKRGIRAFYFNMAWVLEQ